MLKLFYKNNGAVTVFLVLILVPMITVTSIFVDASKIKLTQSVVSSASDVTLNTVLSQYDGDLSEYYGMMASCQNYKEFIDGLDDYFTACMTSSGLDENEARTYTENLMSVFNDEKEVTDVLGIQVKENSFKVEPEKNGALNNPGLIKTQIVEFMKYRSPINKAADIFDALKKAKDSVTNLSKETEMTNKKNKFFKSENELLKLAYNAYENIVAYKKLSISKNSKIKKIKNNLNKNYKEAYEKVHYKTVRDLFNTTGAVKFVEKSKGDDYVDRTYNSDNKANSGNLKNIIKNFAIQIEAYNNAKNNLESTINELTKEPMNKIYKIQYWIQMVNKFNSTKKYEQYMNAVKSLYKNWSQLNNAKDNCEDDALMEEVTITNWNKIGMPYAKNTIGNQYDNIKEIFEDLEEEDIKNKIKIWNSVPQMLVNISDTAINADSTLEYGSINDNAARKKIKKIYEDIIEYRKEAVLAQTYLNQANKSLGELRDKIEEYRSNFREWKGSADDSSLDNSELAKADRKEIEEIEKTRDLLNNVTKEKVQKLIDRLSKISELFEKIVTTIDQLKYNKKLIKEIKNFDIFKQVSKISSAKIKVEIEELDKYSKETFSFSELEEIKVTKKNSPDLDNSDPKLDFYEWLKERFKNYKAEDKNKENAEDKYDEYENMADEESKEEDKASAGCSKNEIKNSSDKLPSIEFVPEESDVKKSGSLSQVAKFVSNLFSDFKGTLLDAAISLRDDLYVSDYITSMFSYDTFKNEKLHDWAVSEGKNVTYKNHSTVYKPYEQNWENSKNDATVKWNKTLTNHMIDTSTCYSYGNEIEYILYGGTNAANKAKSYGSIYMIRFAFDITPVFMLYYDTSTPEGQAVEAIAVAISSATFGVIPAELVKMAICIGITAAEAATDLIRMKAGMGVKLIKTKSDLIIKFVSADKNNKKNINGGIDKNKSNDTASKSEIGYFQYSDYLTLFLMLKLMNDEKATGIYLRTADVIQSNMSKITSKDFLMSNAQVYFRLNVDIQVEPLMLGLPINTDSNGNMFDISSWNTYSYSAVRGY
ncbi:MAG: DUF5702 domain-containing protein [Eubacterium sp.]